MGGVASKKKAVKAALKKHKMDKKTERPLKGQRSSSSNNGKRGTPTAIAESSSSTPRSSCSSVTQLEDNNIPPTQPSATHANSSTQHTHVMRVGTRQTDNKKVIYNTRKSRQRSISASSGTSVSPSRQHPSSPARNNLNRHSSPTRTSSQCQNNSLNDNEDPTDKNNAGLKQEWVSPGRFIYSPNITDITRSCKLNRKFSPNTNNNSNKRNNRNKQNTSPDRSSSPVRLHNSKTPFKTATVTPAPTILSRNPLSLNRFGFSSTGKVKSGDSTDSVNSILSDAQPAISDSNSNLFEEEEKANNLSGTRGNRKNRNRSVEQADNSAKQHEQTPTPLRRSLNTCSKSNLGNNISRPSSLTSTPAHHNPESNRITAHTKQLPKPQVATVKSVTPKTPQMNNSSRTTPVKSSYRSSSTNSLNGTRTQPTEFGKSLRTTPRVSRDSKPTSKSINNEADSGLGSSSESDKIRGLEGVDSGDTDTVNSSEPNSESQDTSDMWLKMNKSSGNKNSTVKRRSGNFELLQNSNSPSSSQSKINSQIKKVTPSSSTKDKSDSPQMTYSMARQKIAPYNRSNRFGYGNYSTEKKNSPTTPNGVSAPSSTSKIPDNSSTVKSRIANLETTPSTSTKQTAPQSVLRRSNLKRPANRPTSLEKTPYLVMSVVQKTVELSKPVYRKLEYCENGRADSSDDLMSKSLEKISTPDTIVSDMLIMDSVAIERNLFNEGKELNSELSDISSLDDSKLSPVRTVTVDRKTESGSGYVSHSVSVVEDENGSVAAEEIGGFESSYLSSSRDLCLINNDDSSQMDNNLSPLTPDDSVHKIETPQSESSFEILESVSESVDSSADYTRYSTDTREDTTSVSLSIVEQSTSKESRESTIIEVKNNLSDVSSDNAQAMLTSIESIGASVTLMSNSIVTNTEPVESVVTLIKSMDAPMTIEEPKECVYETCDRSSTSAESIMDRSMTSIESIDSQISKASSVLIKDTFNASMTVAPPSPPRIIRPPVPEKPRLSISPKREIPHTQSVKINENFNENLRNTYQIQQNSKELSSSTMEPVVHYDDLNNVEMMNTANTNRNKSTTDLISSLETQIIMSSQISDAKESNLSSSEVVDRNMHIKSTETINVHKQLSPETVNMCDSTAVRCMTDSLGSKPMSESITGKSMTDSFPGKMNESITGKSMSDSFPGKSMSDSFSGRSMSDSFNSGKCTPTTRGQSAEMDQDFLIDDEIADQPELMFYGGGSSLTSSFFGDENLFDDLGSPSPALSHAATKPEDILRHPALEKLQNLENRSRTNSVCTNSSMGADDLMLDYDIDEGPKQASGYDEEVLSPDASEIFHEWTAMMAEVSPHGHGASSPLVERCVSRESNGGGGSSTASVNGSSGGSRSGSRARLTSTGSSSDITQGENARTRTILRPPRQGGLAESDLSVDKTNYHYMCQDVTAIKTMLLRLRRVLHNADTINPFHANIKNAMYLSLGSDSSGNVTPTGDREPALNQVAQENIDLKRQVVLLQQQLDDRDRTIRLLQQQLQQQQATVNSQTVATSPTASRDGSRGSERTNAATQTERSFRPMAASGSSSLSRTTSIDDGLGPTVSSECEGRGRSISAPNSHQRVTRRAISQPPALLVTRDNSNAS